MNLRSVTRRDYPYSSSITDCDRRQCAGRLLQQRSKLKATKTNFPVAVAAAVVTEKDPKFCLLILIAFDPISDSSPPILTEFTANEEVL